MYEKSINCFWKAEDIDLSRGYEDWVKLTSDGKHFIEMVLAFSAPSDGIVTEKLVSRIMVKIQAPSTRYKVSWKTYIRKRTVHTSRFK